MTPCALRFWLQPAPQPPLYAIIADPCDLEHCAEGSCRNRTRDHRQRCAEHATDADVYRGLWRPEFHLDLLLAYAWSRPLGAT